MPTTSKTTATKATTKANAKAPAKKLAAKTKPKQQAAKPELSFADGSTGSYHGSPCFRATGKALTPVSQSKPARDESERDRSFVVDLRKLYGKKAFKRLDIDAGVLGRALTLGNVKHVSGTGKIIDGAIVGRDAQFQLID